MPSSIVIRIVPQKPVDAGTFASYLSNNGGLQITAFDLSFNSPTSGTSLGTATYLAPAVGTPTPTTMISLLAPVPTEAPPGYPAGTTNGIVQQINQINDGIDFPYYQAESVATAVIEVLAPTTFENLLLVAQWGSGAGAQTIPITQEYYDVAQVNGSTPDPNTWYSLAPSLYLSLPAPANAGGTSLTLPSDGTPPPFDSLKTAITNVLGVDPGGAAPDLGKLTQAQCRNIAYEIVWSQQPPIPSPPDPIESLYTSPTNSGSLFNGSSPNPLEGDREQFEAKLTGYYAIANASADRLSSFVFSVAAAVNCEEQSLAATTALLEFPVNPALANSAEAEVILTALGGATASFGVPAAYFYALGATMPAAMTATQRYNLAVGGNLPQTLATLTAALNANTVTDSEAFVTSGAPAAINAAQAARRLGAVGIPSGSTVTTLALTAALQPLVTAWLAFAAGDASPSSETYQPTDDAAFWQNAATSAGEAAAFLALVLAALVSL